MSDNRKAAEAKLLERIQSLTPKSSKNKELYEARFKSMSDVQFKQFIERLANGQEVLMVVSPNHSDDGLSLENNLEIADRIGHNFFTKVLTVGKQGVPDHLTPIEYMVIDLPVRRLSQTSDKKIKVPKSTRVIDSLTGQVTGESKGDTLSGPEIQILSAMGLTAPLIESMKYRGGDLKGRNALTAMMIAEGQVNLESLERYSSGVESTAAVKTYLTAAHLKNSL